MPVPAETGGGWLANQSQLTPDILEMELGGAAGIWRLDRSGRAVSIGPVGAHLLGSPGLSSLTLKMFSEMADVSGSSDSLASVLLDGARSGHCHALFTVRQSGGVLELFGGFGPLGLCGLLRPARVPLSSGDDPLRGWSGDAELLRRVVESFPGPLAAWDRDQRLEIWNQAFVRVFGLSDEAVQRGASYDSVMAEANRSVRSRQSDPDDSTSLLLLLSDQWISFVDQKISDGGMISVGLDITHIKRQEIDLQAKEGRMRRLVEDLDRTRGQAEELAKRYEEAKIIAERASASKSVFLANMSHELRTPLNAINGFSEMILNQIYGPLGDARYKGYAEDIHQSGQHLLDMINDILDIAKIEAGKMSLSLRQIDPIEPIDAAVRMIRRRATDKEIALHFASAGDLPEIEADHRAIKQMILNLISNAIKFTDSGGRIDVVARVVNEQIAVSVRDTGIGIPEEDIPRLARPFEQSSADESRNSEGTGLGLALTKSFAEMHGGRMTIHSRRGEGTIVTFYLPVSRYESHSAGVDHAGGTREAASRQEA